MTEESKQIQRVALLGFLINLALAGAKTFYALSARSLAVTASAVDSGSDAAASLAVYGGLRLSTRKTRRFPLGLYKIENLISVVMALFIFFAGYEILGRILHPTASPPNISLPLLFLLAGNVLGIFLFGRYAMRVGKRTGSPTLVAEGRHRQVDVVSTAVVLLSASAGYTGVRWSLFGLSIDQLAGAVVLVFIARVGWELLSDGMRVLLDASVDHETLLEVRRIIESEPLVTEIRELVGRSAGRFRFIQAEVQLRTEELRKAHDVIEQIKSKIREQVPHVDRLTIHYEPQKRTHLRIAVPLRDGSGTISEKFGESPHFALVVVRLSDGRITEQDVRDAPAAGTRKKGRGIEVARWLVEQGVDHVVTREDLSEKGPGFALQSAGIGVHRTDVQDVPEAVRSVLDGRRATHDEGP
jgi:cation diffusion facilitator family transporter